MYLCDFLFQEAVSNMSGSVSQYLKLITQYLDREYENVCEAARKLQVKCHFPKKCSSLADTNDAILYCSLHAAYTYLDNLKDLLQLPVSYHYQKIMDLIYCIFMILTFLFDYRLSLKVKDYILKMQNISQLKMMLIFVIMTTYDIKWPFIAVG